MPDRIEEADDFVDAKGPGGKAWWIAVALMRVGLSFIVVLMFIALLIVVKARFDAEQKLGAAGGGAAAITTTRLFGELAASIPVQVPGVDAVVSPAASPDFVAKIRKAAEDNAAVASIEKAREDQIALVNRQGQDLIDVAKRACGAASSGWDPATEPLVAAGLGATCAGTIPNAEASALLIKDLASARTAYLNAHGQLEAVNKTREERLKTVYVQRLSDEGDLAQNYEAIGAHDQLMSVIPNDYVKAFLTQMFGAPMLLSTALLVFIAGMFGAVVIQFVLIAFPGYLPMTLGAGSHFFLRVPMGGVIALLVVLALQSGLAITELGGLSGGVGDLSGADPSKLAFIGLLAGAFAEKIGTMVVGYVDRLGGGSAPPPADPAPVEEPDTGLMSPGAAEEQRFR